VSRFPKYERAGAYHWGKLSNRSLRGYHARLWARYGWVNEHIAQRSGLVIDVGAGDAALTHLLCNADRAVIGIEPEPDALAVGADALAAVGSSARLMLGDAYALPFADGEASVVVMCEVIEHLDRPDDAVAEAARVLGSSGELLISTPNAQPALADPFHVHEFTASELCELIGRHFREVGVWVAEPGWLLSAYRWRAGRIVVNMAAFAGANPFRYCITSTRPQWRQLYARAHR